MFDTQLKTALPRVHQDLQHFSQTIDAMGPKKLKSYISSASPRQLTQDELYQALAGFETVTCPNGYSICAGEQKAY